jgi:rubrerythrin
MQPTSSVEPSTTEPFAGEAYASRSRALDLSDIPWDEVPRHPLPPDAVRTLRYMQDIEGHTIVYLRELLATRAIDDPEVATFLACWFYEETAHARGLARFLEAAGHAPIRRQRSVETWRKRLEAVGIALVAKAWPEFVAVHMTWGAINELTTLTGYNRVAELVDHPVLREMLSRIVRDEARHFHFYYSQAQRRLARPGAARIARFLVERFWAPVGSGVAPAEETRFLAAYLLAGPDGRAAARKIDETIRRLPGFAGVPLVEAWVEREVEGRAAEPPRRALAAAS